MREMRKSVIIILVVLFSVVASAKGQFLNPMTNVALPPMPSEMSFAKESVPMDKYDVRESLQREMLVSCYLHSRTMLTLLNMKRYFSIIEPIMELYGVPEDFKYLCMAESGLDPDVVSHAGAAGLWQIMPATGRSFGLEVVKGLDERFHIEKCTEAACKYILKSYEIFGSWTMTAAAYNLGDAGVKRRLEAQGTGDYYDTFLPDETQRYIFRILSLKLIGENPRYYGFDIPEQHYYPPLTDYRQVEINEREIDWSQVAVRYGTSYKMLRQVNHWIRDYTFKNSSGKTYLLKIPNQNFRTQPATQ